MSLESCQQANVLPRLLPGSHYGNSNGYLKFLGNEKLYATTTEYITNDGKIRMDIRPWESASAGLSQYLFSTWEWNNSKQTVKVEFLTLRLDRPHLYHHFPRRLWGSLKSNVDFLLISSQAWKLWQKCSFNSCSEGKHFLTLNHSSALYMWLLVRSENVMEDLHDIVRHSRISTHTESIVWIITESTVLHAGPPEQSSLICK